MGLLRDSLRLTEDFQTRSARRAQELVNQYGTDEELRRQVGGQPDALSSLLDEDDVEKPDAPGDYGGYLKQSNQRLGEILDGPAQVEQTPEQAALRDDLHRQAGVGEAEEDPFFSWRMFSPFGMAESTGIGEAAKSGIDRLLAGGAQTIAYMNPNYVTDEFVADMERVVTEGGDIDYELRRRSLESMLDDPDVPTFTKRHVNQQLQTLQPDPEADNDARMGELLGKKASAEKVQGWADEITKNYQDAKPEFLQDEMWTPRAFTYNLVESMVAMAPGLLASVATGSPLPSMATIGIDKFGNVLKEGMDAGMLREDAAKRAIISAGFEAGTEQLPVGRILGLGEHAAKAMSKRIFGAMIAEGGQEAAVETLDTLADAFWIQTEKLSAESHSTTFGEWLEQTAYSFVLGATMGGAMTAGVGGLQEALTNQATKDAVDRGVDINDLLPEERVDVGAKPAEDIDGQPTIPETTIPDAAAGAAPAPDVAVEPEPVSEPVEKPDVGDVPAVQGTQAAPVEVPEQSPTRAWVRQKETGEYTSDDGFTIKKASARKWVVEGPDGVVSTEPTLKSAKAAIAEPAQQAQVEVEVEVAGQTDTVEAKPTEAQIESGNYKKAHVKWQGFDVSIENAKGMERTGTNRDGTSWSVEMPASYGYIRRTKGADAEQVDIYVGDNPESDRVYVVNQNEADTGKFDEHKVMAGFDSMEQAVETYDAGFSDGRGPDRRGDVVEMSTAEFKEWIKSSDTTKPVTARPLSLETPAETAPEAISAAPESGAPEAGISPAASEAPAAAPEPAVFKPGMRVESVSTTVKGKRQRGILHQNDDGSFMVKMQGRRGERGAQSFIDDSTGEIKWRPSPEVPVAEATLAPRKLNAAGLAYENAEGSFEVQTGDDSLGQVKQRRDGSWHMSDELQARYGAETTRAGKSAGAAKRLINRAEGTYQRRARTAAQQAPVGQKVQTQVGPETFTGTVQMQQGKPVVLMDDGTVIDYSPNWEAAGAPAKRETAFRAVPKADQIKGSSMPRVRAVSVDGQHAGYIQRHEKTGRFVVDDNLAHMLGLESKASRRLPETIKNPIAAARHVNELLQRGPDVRQSKAGETLAPRYTGEQVRALIDPVVNKWDAKAPKIYVADSFETMPDMFRGWLMDSIGLPRGSDTEAAALRGTRAFTISFSPTEQSIVLVAETMSSDKEVYSVLAHEMLGHAGMLQMLGNAGMERMERDVIELARHVLQKPREKRTRNEQIIAEVAFDVARNYPGVDQSVFAKELIAHMAEMKIKHPTVDRLIAGMRRFLRSLGINVRFNTNELRAMIRSVNKFLHDPTSAPEAERSDKPQVYASRHPGRPNTTVEARRNSAGAQRWAEGSYAVDDTGSPRALRRSTKGEGLFEPPAPPVLSEAVHTIDMEGVDSDLPSIFASRVGQGDLSEADIATYEAALADFLSESQVKEETGEAKVLYHGTSAANTLRDERQHGIWATDDRQNAIGYAGGRRNTILEEPTVGSIRDTPVHRAGVVPMVLDIRNPLIIESMDGSRLEWTGLLYEDLFIDAPSHPDPHIFDKLQEQGPKA